MADNIDYTGAPKIGPKIDPGGGVSINAPAEAFGTSLFGAIHGLGKTGFDAAIQKQELANDLDHNERAINASKELSDIWSKYGQLEGDAAAKGLPGYQKNITDLYKRYVEDPTAPPAVKQSLARQLVRDVDRYMSHGANYADTQLRHWHEKVHKDGIENNIDQIVLNRKQPVEDIEHMIEHGTAGVGGADSVRDIMLHKFGKDTDLEAPEVKAAIEGEVAKYRSEAVDRVVKALANEGDIAGAKRVFDRFKDRLGAKGFDTIEGFLKPKLDDAWVMEQADQHKPIPGEGFPTDAAGQRRLEVGQAAPTRQAAAALGGPQMQTPAAGAYRGQPLPAETNKAIDKSAAATGISPDLLRTFANIESSGRRGERTGRYKGVFQLSDEEFKLHGKGDIFNAEDNALAAANKIKADTASFRLATGRDATPFDLYMIHQQGPAGAPAHFKNPEGVAWKNIRPFYSDSEAHKRGFEDGDAMAKAAVWKNVPEDQRSKFPGGVDSLTSGQFLEMWRGKYARLSGGEAPAAGTQPGSPQDSILSPGYTARQAHRESNLVNAHALAGGDPVRERKLYAEFNRRDVLLKENLSGERQRIDGIVKDFELQASKGKAGITLESMGITESQIRAAHADKPWKAEQIIEQARMQEDVANHLDSLKFASHDEISNYVYSLQAGLGIDAMTEKYRKDHGTQGAFISADPSEVIHGNFALQEKLAKTGREYLSRYQEIMSKNAAQWGITEKHPVIMEALKAVENANTPEESAKAFRDYAAAQVSFQLNAGVPEKDIHILTATAAEKQAGHIINSSDPKGVMDQLSKQHGGMWNKIFQDIVKLGKLPANYEATQYLDDENARILSRMTKQEYDAVQEAEKNKTNPRAMEERLGLAPDGKPNKRVVDAAIDNDQTYKDIRLSFERRGINMDTRWPEIEKSIKTLAYGRVSGAGMGEPEVPGTAATKALEAFSANYVITNDKAMLPKANSTEIQQIMGYVKESLTNKDTHIPGWTAQAHRTGTPDENRYLQLAKANGKWVNTRNGDGVEYRDHSNRTMRYKDGSPVRVMFSNLEDSRVRMKKAQYFQQQEDFGVERNPQLVPEVK